MAMWISVSDAESTAPIRNAYFSVSWFNNNDGNYYVYLNPGDFFWTDADGYNVRYQSAELGMRVSLPRAVWPNR